MTLDQLDTPCVVVDLDRMERNIARLQGYLTEHGLASRPHIKTHKIPQIAERQIACGAVGITCQKIGEAEVMVRAGIRDIFIPYNILGSSKLERLVALCRQAEISVTADSRRTVEGLSSAASSAQIVLPVLVEFDTGHGRCGVQSPAEAVDLARYIAHLPGLRYGGLMTFPANEETDGFVSATKGLLYGEGIATDRVTIGGTPGMWQAHTWRQATEYRAGTYVYGDRATLRSGAMVLEDCALTVLATVVSRPTRSRGILDAGSKALSSDLLMLEGYGLVLEYPEGRITQLSEEHGTVDFSDCPKAPEVGERVTILPNHCCVVSNLFDEVVGVRNGRIELTWPVAARGALQ